MNEEKNISHTAAEFTYNLKKANDRSEQILMMQNITQLGGSRKPCEFEAFAHELDLDKLVHLEKDKKTKYFEIQPGTFNFIQLCENLSIVKEDFNKMGRTTTAVPSYFLFEHILFGLQDKDSIKIIMDNILKAGNLTELQNYWKGHGFSIIENFQNRKSHKTNADWAMSTFFPK